MKYSHPMIRRLAQRLPVLCALYFEVFAFIYLLLLQRDVLAQAQYQFSEGEELYHPLVGASLCTLLLMGLAVLLARFMHWLPLRLKAAPWFPSFFLLGLLTHWRFPQYGDLGSSPSWIYLGVLVVAYGVMLLLGDIFMDSSKERETASTYVWPNLLLLALFSLVTVSLSNTDERLHHTLRSIRLAAEGNYDQILIIAHNQQHPTRQLSAATAFALSQQGLLGEQLFAYPQPFGASGLLPQRGDTLLFAPYVRSIGNHLGFLKTDRTPDSLFYEAAFRRPHVKPALRNYWLCALLLDRNLPAFRSSLLESDTLSSALPRHYREALLLEQQLRPLASDTLVDEELSACFLQFDSLRLALSANPDECELRCREQFPGTYWTYYYFPHNQK